MLEGALLRRVFTKHISDRKESKRIKVLYNNTCSGIMGYRKFVVLISIFFFSHELHGINEDSRNEEKMIEKNLLMKLESQCAGQQYYNRIFERKFQQRERFDDDFDDPTAIARNVDDRLIFIEGGRESGKSVALAKIQYISQKEFLPETILVDISKIVSSDRQTSITLGRIIESLKISVHRTLYNTLQDLLNNNKLPQQIRFLFDGMDKVPPEQMSSMVSIIKDLNERRISVVLTSRNDVPELLSEHGMTPTHYIIPNMNPAMVESYLTEIWKSKLALTTSDELRRVREYANLVATELGESQFPRTLFKLEKLAVMLLEPGRNIFGGPESQYGISCRRYVRSATLTFAQLQLSLKYARPDMIYLYDRIINYSPRQLTPTLRTEVYGPYALKMLGKSADYEPWENELAKALQNADEKITKYGTEAFDRMHFPSGSKQNPSHFFEHIDQSFYASDYILTELQKSQIPLELVRKVFMDPVYRHVLESINSIVRREMLNPPSNHKQMKNLKKIMGVDTSENPYFLTEIMDNVLRHGFDSIGVKILELSPPKFVKAYMESDTLLKIHFKYSFGMLSKESESEAKFNKWNPYSRQEMLMKMNMHQSLKFIFSRGFFFSSRRSYQRQLDMLATHGPIDQTSIELVLGKMPLIELHPDFLGRLLFKTVDLLGDGCQPIVQRLLEFGAEPSNYVHDDGRTLADAAQKWGSQNLMQFIVEKMHVPVHDTNGIKITASDDSLYLPSTEEHSSQNKQNIIGERELGVQCAGRRYFSRKFRQGTEVSPNKADDDGPTAIAKKLVNRAETSFISIEGGVGSGKSVALIKIHNEVQKLDSKIWTERIDLSTINLKPLDGKTPIVAFFRDTIPTEKLEAFAKTLRRHRVTVLLDNLDRVPSAKLENILNVLRDLNSIGIGIVVSSRKDLSLITKIPSTRYFIDDMKTAEATAYLTHIWKSIIKDQFPHSTEEHLARLEEYAKVQSSEIELTPLPRNPRTLQKLAEALSIHAGLEIFQDSFTQKGESFSDYIRNPELESIHLRRRAQAERLDLIMLYDEIIEYKPFDGAIDFYGPHAVKMALESENSGMEQWHNELTEPLKEANKYIERSGTESFDIMNFQESRPTGFIEPMYQKYFAAKYFLKCLAETEIPLESLRKVFKDPAQRHILELINSGFRKKDQFSSSQWDQMKKNLLKVVHADAAIMDNLLMHGFDVLTYTILKMDGSTFATSYFQEAVQLQSKSKYSFRMLATKATSSAKPSSRREMLTQMNMQSSIKLVNDLGIPFGDNENFPRFLEMVVSHWPINEDLFVDIINEMQKNPKLKKKLQSTFLNRLLFKSLDTVGPDALPIAYRLFKLGADPKKCSINGRTLADVAVKWHNRELVRVIVDDFDVPLASKIRWSKNYAYSINMENAISDRNQMNRVTLENDCAGKKYLSRKFRRQPSTRPNDEWYMTGDDGPTSVAKDIIYHRESSLLTTIEGALGSGKTVTLKKIQQELQMGMHKKSWTVYVDLSTSNFVRKQTPAMTLDNFIEKLMSTDEGDFFSYLLEKQPKSINLLLDNWDRMSHACANDMLAIVKDLNAKSVAVVISGRNDFTALSEMKSSHYQIPDMSTIEIVNYMTQIWESTFKPASVDDSIRMKEYATHLSSELEKTTFPRNPYALEKLGNLLTSEKKEIFGHKSDSGISYTEYVHSPELGPLDLRHNLERARLDMIFLYDSITQASVNKIHLDVYGPYALKMMLPFGHSASWSKELRLVLQNANEIISNDGTRPFKLMEFAEPHKIPSGFIEPMHQNFFAAKYLLKCLGNSRIPSQLLTKIFIDPTYHHVLEFMNAEYRNGAYHQEDIYSKRIVENLGKIMNKNNRFKIMDNLLIHGFDDLASTILKSPNSWSPNYISSNRFLPLKSKYAFGMLSKKAELAEGELKSFTRRAMLRKMNMDQSWSIINQQVPLSSHEDLHMLLRTTATTRPINLEAFDTIISYMKDQMPITQTEFINQVLFETIDKVGDGCQEIAERLIELGAQPQKSAVNGRTLADAAAQWHNEKLMRFVVEKLITPHVTPSRGLKKMLWSSALAANPFPRATPSGWWKMTKYLIDNDLYLVPSYEEVKKLTATKISSPNRKTKFFSLISGKSSESVSISNEELSLLADQSRFETSSSLDLDAEALSLRRRAVLKKCYDSLKPTSFMKKVKNIFKKPKLILPELLAHYRGVDQLSTLDRNSYEACMESSLEKSIFSPRKQKRILIALTNNAVDFKDIEFITEKVIPKLQNGDTTISEKMRIMIEHRMKYQQLSKPSHSPLVPEVLQSVASFYETPLMHNMNSHELERYYDIFTRQRPTLRNMDLSNEPSSSIQGCLGSRRRRALSSIACTQLREDVDRLHDADPKAKRGIINSDKLLKILPLSFSERSRQFIQYLRMMPQRMMTGNYQLLTEEIIIRGGLSEYHEHQRSTNAMSDLPAPQAKPRFFAKIPKQFRTGIGHGANGLMLLRAFQGTVILCTQEQNGSHTDCIIASTALTFTVVLDPLSRLSAKYTPKILHEMGETALHILPYIAPKAVISGAKVFQKMGVIANVISKSFRFARFAPGGFDVYNIVRQSMVINTCSQDGTHCISRDKNSANISLTFSCLAIAAMIFLPGIGFVASALIGLALMVIEMVAQAVNNVVYYHNTYKTTTNEEFRLFWHSMMMADPPSDVTALAERTDTIHSLYEYVIRNLGKSPENVVAYGVGIGLGNEGNIPWSGSINMEQSSMKNTDGLSRVQPEMKDNTIRLCLPKWNRHEEYDKWNETVPTAVFRCTNAFVIADAQRWKKRNENSYINFDLGNINQGIIVGSSTLNNMFQIRGSRSELTIVGGRKKLVNIYVIQDTTFHGTIQLSTESQRNILDLSTGKNNFTSFFKWDHELNLGIVQFNSTTDDAFYLNTERRQSFNLHIIGREKVSDLISCQSGPDNLMPQYRPILTADGGGGESMINMDILTGCKFSKIRSFTQIISPDGQNTAYATELLLESAAEPSGERVNAIIQPKQSHYSLSFTNRPLFSSIFSLQYIPSDRSLVWKLQYIDSTVMVLSILPYYTVHLLPNGNASDQYSVTCVFNDNFFNATIFPIIENPRDSNRETIDVRVFNVFIPVNSSLLLDVVDHYHQMMSMIDEKWNVVIRLTDPTSNSSFTFGSNLNDSFFIDKQLKFVFGGNGPDIYTLASQSPERIWIENEADDDALDTLVVPPDVCSSIWGRSGSVDAPGFDSSAADVTLFCKSARTIRKVVLRNYYLDQRYQHMVFYWQDRIYQLPPREKLYSGMGEKIALTRIIAVDKAMPVVPAEALTSDYNYIFNITGSMSSLVRYREGSDLIMVEKEMDLLKSLFIQLIGFFRSEKSQKLSSQWLNNEITMTSDKNSILTKYNVNDILKIPIRDPVDHGVQGDSDYHEYFINMTDPNIKDPFSTVRSDYFFISGHRDAGIIKVIGANPREFNASWDTSGTNSSCLLKLCIPSKDCCHSFSRVIFRIEFLSSPYQYIAIPMHQLTCDDGGTQSHSRDQSNKRLSDEFIYAQSQLEMPSLFNDSDMSRLRRCIGSLYADKLSYSFMYKLFGFSSIIDQLYFMNNSCNMLFRRKDLMTKLSREEMHGILIKLLDAYTNISWDESVLNQASILRLRKKMNELDSQNHWEALLKSLTSTK